MPGSNCSSRAIWSPHAPTPGAAVCVCVWGGCRRQGGRGISSLAAVSGLLGGRKPVNSDLLSIQEWELWVPGTSLESPARLTGVICSQDTPRVWGLC